MTEEWIEHDGKGIPVDFKTKVEVEYKPALHETRPVYGSIKRASKYRWTHDNDVSDIIAYRVVKP